MSMATNRAAGAATRSTRILFSGLGGPQRRALSNPPTKSDGVSDLELLNDDIAYYAEKRQTGVSLQLLTETGKGKLVHLAPNAETRETTAMQKMLFQVAMFLHRELPIRLAHRVRDLDSIPLLNTLEGTRQVRRMYAKSFEEIRAAPTPNNTQRENYFSELLDGIYNRHGGVLLTMAQAAYELRAEQSELSFEHMEEIHRFLDSFYLSRIGIRMLIGQYLTLRSENEEGLVGLVDQATSPAAVARAAIEDAEYMCTQRYSEAPDVEIKGRDDLTFQYVPTHLHYILLELLKNSMRAVVEQRQKTGAAEMPAIKVIIADGEENEDVVIKVSDEGGGIPRSDMKRMWSYLFTTADPNVQLSALGKGSTDFATSSPLAGLGYGLPISRAYARYFGGDLQLISMEGYGTDAFVHLSRLGTTKEKLV